jgi:hypothetical protein
VKRGNGRRRVPRRCRSAIPDPASLRGVMRRARSFAPLPACAALQREMRPAIRA